MRRELEANVSGDWRVVVENDERIVAEEGSGKKVARPPAGYRRLRIAGVRARAARTRNAAELELDHVILWPNDLRWLGDVRVMMRAEIAHHLGDRAAENEAVDDVMRRQPMLFEPEHAFSLGLLTFQERLKPRYRTTRGR
jgi:hypothetical protein